MFYDFIAYFLHYYFSIISQMVIKIKMCFVTQVNILR